jgi:hypothetical protein
MTPLQLRLVLYACAMALVGVVLAAFIRYERAVGDTRGAARIQAAWDADKAEAQHAAAQALALAAAESQRRISAKEEVIHETTAQLDRARADAGAAVAAGQRLRSDLAAYVDASRGGAAADPAPASTSAPASDALDVLSDLFSRADSAAGDLAQVADQARLAGLACERSYDALIH